MYSQFLHVEGLCICLLLIIILGSPGLEGVCFGKRKLYASLIVDMYKI